MVHIPLRALGPGRLDEPLRVELRLVYTIDEFPFPGRGLAEPPTPPSPAARSTGRRCPPARPALRACGSPPSALTA
jgi:hypothetical protein